ncbi:Protein kinase-like domain [Pseudocohnilembus persalinus]|uniref:non-specific serine/threonine protein kinase n=1 Tax=Pseudocohnilembus persalinus TaxID=266149 RepID=A0A0V0R6T4_PSEPJ|nr:Protein kinase-like domain [Pseudocohnilembus persalinus]|eukprot:KRX10221.1 Protein kinase-like domain [Pseudocohnilembus persalinus]
MSSKTPKSESTLRDFEFLGKLGQGSFGVVYKVRRKLDSKVYVMKQINISKMNTRMKADAINEVTILAKLNHPHIVKYYDSFIDRNLLNIVMEYCEGGDVNQVIKQQFGRPLKEERIWKFFIQMTQGLEYIHKRKILHRDIKTMNMFLQKDEVRIGDLGVAKVLSNNMDFARTMVGTPFYLSPEMCEEKPYNEKSDIWALGCVLYELCTYKHPFEAKTQGALILKIIRGKYPPISNNYSRELIELVDQLLRRDYKSRPTTSQILSKGIVQQKAKQYNIETNPQIVDHKQDYEQKQKKTTESVSKQPSDTKTSGNSSNRNGKVSNIQNQIVSEQKRGSNQNIKDKNILGFQKQDPVKPSPAMRYKDPTKVQQSHQVFQSRENKIQEQKHQREIKQKPQSLLNKDNEQRKSSQGIINAYNEKQIQNPSNQNRVQHPQSAKVQQSKIKQSAFNLPPSGLQNADILKKNNNNVPKYPFSKQAEIVKQRAQQQQQDNQKLHQNPFIQAEKIQLKPSQGNTPRSARKQASPVPYQKKNSENNLKAKNEKNPYPFKKQESTPISHKQGIQDKNRDNNNIFQERDNVARIRKGAPQQLSRQAQLAAQRKEQPKQLFGYEKNDKESYLGQKPLISQKKNSSANQSRISKENPSGKYDQQDYEDVMNLPDVVGKKKSSQSLNIKEEAQIKSDGSSSGANKSDVPKKQQDLEYEKVFGRKLHNQDEVVKALDQHLYGEKQIENLEKIENVKQDKNQIQKQTGQKQVDNKFIENEFGSSSDEDDSQNNKIQQKISNNQQKQVQEEIQHFTTKKEPISISEKIKNDSQQQEKGDVSTNINEEEEQSENDTEEEEFTIQKNNPQLTLNQSQENSNENSEQTESEENESNEKESENEDNEENLNNSDKAYYDDDEEEENSQEENENSQEEDENSQEEDENSQENSQENSEEEEEEEEEKVGERQFLENEEENNEEFEGGNIEDEDEDNIKLKTVDVQRAILQKRFDDTNKRQLELQKLLDIKTAQCVKSLGEEKYNAILFFFRNKLNSDSELSNDDQEQIDEVIQKHVTEHNNPQLIFSIYKILHLEIEIEKQREKLGQLVKQISSQEDQQSH